MILSNPKFAEHGGNYRFKIFSFVSCQELKCIISLCHTTGKEKSLLWNVILLLWLNNYSGFSVFVYSDQVSTLPQSNTPGAMGC